MKSIQKVLALVLALMILIPAACAAGEGSSVSVTAGVTKIDAEGTVFLDLTRDTLAEAGIHVNDIVTVTMNGKQLEMPVCDTYEFPFYRKPFVVVLDDHAELFTRFGSFLTELGFATQVVDGNSYKWEWAEGTAEPETVLIELKEAGGYKPAVQNLGMLSLLNLSEDALDSYVKLANFATSTLITTGKAALNPGAPEYLPCDMLNIRSYDTLNALMLALNSGEVSCALVSECVADYICSQYDMFVKQVEYCKEEDLGYLNNLMYNTLSNDYAIMLTGDKAELRDKINTVLKEMKEDGTLSSLIQDYIADGTGSGTNQRVEFEQFDGAETIRFIVTGDLPPMDYVQEDGTPAGFSTAVLAEIGKRTKCNIEVMVGENLSRAMALEVGQADAAFWTRSKVSVAEWMDNFNPLELAIKEKTMQLGVTKKRFSVVMTIMTDEYTTATLVSDIPDGILTTDPYYSDPMVLIFSVSGDGSQWH